MSDKFHMGEHSDQQVCSVFSRSDFSVTSGVNAGEGISGPAESMVGDIYQFSAHSTPSDFAFDAHDEGRQEFTPINNETSGPGSRPAGEHSPSNGGFGLDSRLTFMGADGSTVEVLIVRGDNSDALHEQAAHEQAAHEPAEMVVNDGYFLPLKPLKPHMDYTLIKADDDPGFFDYSDYTCVCFTRGTMIRMADGTEKAIEQITEGDMVLSRDNGAQAVRWIGSRTVPAFGHLAPIVICKDALGNTEDLIVSQQHRMLLSDWRAEVMLGSHEVLIKARDLTNGDTIYKREGGVVEYFHILFDTHEIIYAEGIPSESLHINQTTLRSLTDESRAEIIELFPEIETEPQVSAVASRMSLKSYEASALLKQVGFR